MRFSLAVLACAFIIGSGVCAAPQNTPITKDQAQNWIKHLIPLPKSIDIASETVVQRGQVSVFYGGKSDQVTDQTIKELVELFGAYNVNTPASDSFKVVLQLGGPNSEPLKKLKNSNQAYRILPVGDNELELVALSSRGLYYAAKTLQQLVAAHSTGNSIHIPVLTVTDWPDMEKRGIWGVDNFNHLKWLAKIKMNHMEQISHCGMDEKGQVFARLSSDERNPLLYEGPLYGIDFAPVVLHLEQVLSDNMRKFNPEFQGVNTPRKSALCYSQPGVTDMISEWIFQLASMANVNEVDVWMAENMRNMPGCQCDKCKLEDRSVLEIRTIIAASEKAKQKLGRDIIIYILTSEETEDSNPKVFAELPEGMRIWYYHSLFTYLTSEMPQLRPYIAETVKSGKWVGVCPNLDSMTHFYQPFTGAAFINYRIDEYLTKGLSGIIGYPTPRMHYCDFNVEATAEWTWNFKGRSTREFAESYAIRHGFKDPAKYAEWSETLGPVAWDVHGSAWPSGEQRGVPESVAKRLQKGTLSELGYFLWDIYPTPWGDFKNEKQLYDGAANVEKALRLAKELKIPTVMDETLIVDGYMQSLKALYELKKLAPNGVIAPEDRFAATRHFQTYLNGLTQVVNTLPKWENRVKRESEEGVMFTDRPSKFIKSMIKEMETTAAEMGCSVSAK